MNAADIAVLIGGFLAVGLIYGFFFGGKETIPASYAEGTKGAARADLTMTGMTCAACVGRVEKAALRVPGVTEAAVNLLANSGVFRYDRNNYARPYLHLLSENGLDRHQRLRATLSGCCKIWLWQRYEWFIHTQPYRKRCG